MGSKKKRLMSAKVNQRKKIMKESNHNRAGTGMGMMPSGNDYKVEPTGSNFDSAIAYNADLNSRATTSKACSRSRTTRVTVGTAA